MSKTYTVLITLSGRQPADLKALADRIAADLETGTVSGASFSSAQCDVFEGDCTDAKKLPREGFKARKLHGELSANGSD